MGQAKLYGQKSTGMSINGIIESYYAYKGEDIKAGDLVEYINGLAEIKDYGNSTNTTLSSAKESGKMISAVALDDKRVFIAHGGNNYSYLYGMIVLIEGNKLVIGAHTQLSTANYTGSFISVALLPNGNVFIGHTQGSSYWLYGMICKISGTTIAVGYSTSLATANNEGTIISVSVLDNGNVFIAHRYGTSYILYGIACTIGANGTITKGTDTQISSSGQTANRVSTTSLSNNRVFVTFANGTTYKLYGNIVKINGTTITKGTDTAIIAEERSGDVFGTAKLSDTKVFIACRTDSNVELQSIICTISDTTITNGTITSLSTVSHSGGGKITSSLLSNGNVLVVHSTDSNYTISSMICRLNGDTILSGTDLKILNYNASARQFNTVLINNLVFISHINNNTDYYLYSQIFGIDEKENVLTTNIVLPQYETQVRKTTTGKFDGVAKTNGKGSPEYVEALVLKQGNIFPTSGWVSQAANGTKYTHSKGWVIEASGVDQRNNYAENVSRLFDNNTSQAWGTDNACGTPQWAVITCPEPTKITKMTTKVSSNWTYLNTIYIQGKKNDGNWINLIKVSSASTTEWTLNNADYYDQYRLYATFTNASYSAFSYYEWQTTEYETLGLVPSTEHNEQVEIYTRNFKQLSSLPIGALVKDVNSTFLGEPVIWKIADINHEGYPDDSITLITERSIAIRAFDAKEPNNSDTDRQTYGNNRYSVSNIRQWLNSDAEAGQWYLAQHGADQEPSSDYVSANAYSDKVGFLNAFSQQFKNALLETTLTVALNTVTDGGESETVTDKVFLASNTEVGLENENSIVEGTLLPIFSDGTSRLAYCTAEAVEDGDGTPSDDTKIFNWWLRTPVTENARSTRCVNATSGANTNNYDFFGRCGVRPLCNISSSALVYGKPDSDGCYRIIFS